MSVYREFLEEGAIMKLFIGRDYDHLKRYKVLINALVIPFFVLTSPASLACGGGWSSGSTPFLRTLQRSPIMGVRSVYAKKKEVQSRVQARRC